MNIAIVGATGNVGRKVLDVLERKNLPISEIFLVASARSAGSKINFKGKDIEVENLETFDFSKAKITFFAAGGKISEAYASKAANHSIVIDNSSFYRMDPDVPLIVPQVNADDLKNIKKNIIANPNCSTAQLVLPLKPIHELFKIKRVVVATYQSVSGGGKAPMDELVEQTKLALENKKIESKNFTKQISFNLIPHIDTFADDGYTKEELKMTNETKKILDQNIELSATCVRVPVLVSHSEAVNLELEKAGRVEDFIGLGEVMIHDALTREESCGGHFREEHQTEENEAKRDDENYSHVSAWEYKKDGSKLHKEQLEFENVKLTTRSYK